jgi:uncharacterized RDD family membrane protein YckC
MSSPASIDRNPFREVTTVVHVQAATLSPTDVKSETYAGFWRRLLALIIDWVIVSTIVSIVFLLIAAAIPEVGNSVRLQVPFDLFTIEKTLESKTLEPTSSDGVKVARTEKIIEQTVLAKWTYLYRVTESVKPGASSSTTETRQRIDPVTRQDINGTDLDNVITVVLFLYWILMEASRYQASFGKLAMGMKVVDIDGNRLTLPLAAGRNLLKILSALTLFIGFMMAGWTKRKQALHDKIVNCYVVVRS